MQKIPWGEFGFKHKVYNAKSTFCKMNVAEGSIRAGKTIDNCINFCRDLETTPDKIHLATGSTLANAKLNIGDCNGFGLEYQFKGRCKWGKYKDNEALYVNTKTGDKVVIFAGGGKADSYKKILGNSYGLWIATEINEHYDCDDSKSSFIKVAMGRQIASKNPKMYWDMNPCNPKHRIYKEYIDKYQEDGLVGGYNYMHFTIEDNANLDEQRKAEIRSQYRPGTIWYKRDILGQRCVSEGVIYEDFANNTEKYLIKTPPEITHLKIGVDFGGNKSAHTFVCVGFTYGLKEVVVLESERIENKQKIQNTHETKTITPADLEDKFAMFLKMVYNKYRMGGIVYCDSAEQTLIGGLRTKIAKEGLKFGIDNAKKNEVNQRIKLVSRLMAHDKFKVCEHCKTVIEALSEAVWSSKDGHEDERLDNGTSDIDTLDAMEYAIEPHLKDLKYII